MFYFNNIATSGKYHTTESTTVAYVFKDWMAPDLKKQLSWIGTPNSKLLFEILLKIEFVNNIIFSFLAHAMKNMANIQKLLLKIADQRLKQWGGKESNMESIAKAMKSVLKHKV